MVLCRRRRAEPMAITGTRFLFRMEKPRHLLKWDSSANSSTRPRKSYFIDYAISRYKKQDMPHIHEKIDYTAEVFVVYSNTVLLRKHDKYKIWLSVGGHIELDEDPNQTAIREVKEEVGLDVVLADGLRPFTKETSGYKELIPPMFLNRNRISEKHEHVVLVYFAKSKTDKLILPITKEVSEGCKWFTIDELKNPKFELTKHVQIYANSALDALF